MRDLGIKMTEYLQFLNFKWVNQFIDIDCRLIYKRSAIRAVYMESVFLNANDKNKSRKHERLKARNFSY